MLSADSDPRAARARAAGTLRMGTGEPLVLLHGVLGAASMWKHVLPRLAPHHDVIALSALGHQGGAVPSVRPVGIEHVVADAERALDDLRIERAHLAGNSLGGWVALELARRGRALSVCAFSPAGMWDAPGRASATRKLREAVAGTRRIRPLLWLFALLPALRRQGLRLSAASGERVSPADFVELARALLACSVAEDLLATQDSFQELQVPCPVTVAWSARDRVFRPVPFAERARALVRGAEHVLLENVGHVPMLDDPGLVAETILASTARARGQSSARG